MSSPYHIQVELTSALILVCGCDNATSLLTSILLKAKTRNTPLIVISVDISKAFDHVPWSFLPMAMERIGVSSELTHFLISYMEGAEGKIEGSTTSSLVHATAGVPKDQLRDPTCGMASSTSSSEHWTVSDRDPSKFPATSHLSYADDILLLSTCPSGIKSCLRKLQKFFLESGMSLSLSKCVLATNHTFRKRYGTFLSKNMYSELRDVKGAEFLHLCRNISFDLLSSEGPLLASSVKDLRV